MGNAPMKILVVVEDGNGGRDSGRLAWDWQGGGRGRESHDKT